jgi:hypothetical protein
MKGKTMKEMAERGEVFERVLEVLEEIPYRSRKEGVKAALKRVASELGLDSETALDEAAEVFLAKEREQALKVLEGFWRALWDSTPPREAVETVNRGYTVRAERVRPWQEEVEVEAREKRFKLRCERAPARFTFEVSPNMALMAVAFALTVEWKRALLIARSLSDVEEVLEGTRHLLPLLSSMGVEDLEKALEALLALEEGEAKAEGPYVLARGKGLWLLRRGNIFGSPRLDAKFLFGEEVALAYPGGVTLVLRGEVSGRSARIREGLLRWGDEAVRLESQKFFGLILENFGKRMVKSALEQALSHANSVKMRALLEELRARRDPLKALEEEGFIGRVKMRALAGM